MTDLAGTSDVPGLSIDPGSKAETGAQETALHGWLNGQAARLGAQLLEAREENRRLRAENTRLRAEHAAMEQKLAAQPLAGRDSGTDLCTRCGATIPAGRLVCVKPCLPATVGGER